MLIVTRKVNETITIHPAAGLDPDMPLSEAFKDGAIEIKLVRIAGRRIRLAIDAPCQLRIWRGDRGKSPETMLDGEVADESTASVDFSAGAREG